MSRADKKAETRRRLIEAAACLFDTLGYEQADLRTITAKAGLTTGAVFSTFRLGKTDLYAAIYGHPPVTPERGRELLLENQRLRQLLAEAQDAMERAA